MNSARISGTDATARLARHRGVLALTAQIRRRAVRRLLGTGVILCTIASGAASASAAQTCEQQFGSFSASSAPPACWRPYGDSSPFNKEIPQGAPAANDAGSIAQHLQQSGYQFESVNGSYIFQTPGRAPVYWSRASDREVTVRCTAYWGPNTCQGANGIVIDGMKIHVPAGAQPEHQWDGHMIVVDQSTNSEYDFERVTWTGPNELTVWSGSVIPIGPSSSTGVGGEADAANTGLLGGIVRASELKAGTINHALAVSVPCTTGYVWPASGPWGEPCGKIGQNSGNALHMGSRLQLNMTDSEIAATGAPRWQRAIMTAMAHYGMYVNDTNGGADNSTIEVESEGDESYTSFGIAPRMANVVHQLGGNFYNGGIGHWVVGGVRIDVAKLRVINPCVAQGSCPGNTFSPQTARIASRGSRAVGARSNDFARFGSRRTRRPSPRRRRHHTRRHHR